MILSRREWLVGAAASAGCASRKTAGGCRSLAGKVIRWIVPFGAGGTYDVYSRLIEPFYEKALEAEIIIVSEPGNGGVVGATKLRDAAPDGRTLGILNAPGLFGASLASVGEYPNPARDFTVLGRLHRALYVLVAAAASPLKSIEDLLDHQKKRPLLCGISGIGSNNFLVTSVTGDLLGLRFDFMTGFSGSRDDVLSVLRGDTDLMASNYETLQREIEQGDMRVLMQVSHGPISDPAALRNVPWLCGPNGWAARRASELGRDPQAALTQAGALAGLIGAGIIVCAPKPLPSELAACMRARFHESASSAAFVSAAQTARRTLEVATGEQTVSDLYAAERHVASLAPIVREAFRRARK